jgi:hypothetical protein
VKAGVSPALYYPINDRLVDAAIQGAGELSLVRSHSTRVHGPNRLQRPAQYHHAQGRGG